MNESFLKEVEAAHKEYEKAKINCCIEITNKFWSGGHRGVSVWAFIRDESGEIVGTSVMDFEGASPDIDDVEEVVSAALGRAFQNGGVSLV